MTCNPGCILMSLAVTIICTYIYLSQLLSLAEEEVFLSMKLNKLYCLMICTFAPLESNYSER